MPRLEGIETIPFQRNLFPQGGFPPDPPLKFGLWHGLFDGLAIASNIHTRLAAE